ncbi:MAG: protoporphyrinogen oxidase HemJ [Gammaproteobacteria bacterium]|jgi:putative membrane protein
MFLWIKALHVIFMVTWFAGLFYLPRLYVYHAQEMTPETGTLFKVMERRLFFIMTLGGSLTVLFGLWMLIWQWGYYGHQVWMHVKLTLVVLLIGYHAWCWKLMRDFRADRNRHSHRWYRWFNEFPSILLILIVILVIVKP